MQFAEDREVKGPHIAVKGSYKKRRIKQRNTEKRKKSKREISSEKGGKINSKRPQRQKGIIKAQGGTTKRGKSKEPNKDTLK